METRENYISEIENCKKAYFEKRIYEKIIAKIMLQKKLYMKNFETREIMVQK